jgi:hypothetical protein
MPFLAVCKGGSFSMEKPLSRLPFGHTYSDFAIAKTILRKRRNTNIAMARARLFQKSRCISAF